MEYLLVFFRMASYILVMIITAVTFTKHCRAKILVANFFLASMFLLTLFLTRFFETGHSREIGLALQSTGIIIWAILHVADFLQNGDKERLKV